MNLIVRSGPDAGASFAVDRRITIGREGDFRLTDPTVSRTHAAVTPTSDGGALLEDLGSTGGTVVNGTRLFGPVTLRGGEQVLLGTTILELVVEAPAPEPAPVVAPAPVPVVAPVPPAASPGPPPAPGAVPPPPTPSPVLPPPAAPGGGDRKKLMIVIAVVVALAVAAAGFVLLGGGDDDAQGGGGGGGGGNGGATGQDGGTGAGGAALAPLTNLGALPGDFAADPTTWTVTLTWDDAPSDAGLDHYEVSRNGKRIAADVAEPTFVDDAVEPGQELNYEVVTVGSAGTSDPAATVVVTPELAVGEGLVTGAWTVQMRITKSNLNDVGATAQLTWDFIGCSFGACDNSFTIRRTDVLGTTSPVQASDAAYSGTGFGEFLLDDCRGDPISETLIVNYTIKKAAVQGGVWAAQTFKGTMEETAESAGCITARRTFAITGTRV